jgi:nicotinamidase-related amidase
VAILVVAVLVVADVQKDFLDSGESSEWGEEVIKREVCECKKQIDNNARLFKFS